MTVNKRAVHSVVQLFISFRGFVHSVFVRSFSAAGARWTVCSLTRSFGYPFARLDVRSLGLPFVRPFAFLVCSVVPPFAQFFLLSMDIKML